MVEQMNNNVADETIVPCDPKVRYIFPVRYALKGSKLEQLLNEDTEITTPTNIKNLVDHELRRIRSGYVYVYSEKMDIWRIFRYLADPSDPESLWDGEIPKLSSADKHQFYEIEWSDGADSKWHKKENSELKHYIPLSVDMHEVWMAYSEECWPALMFELLEPKANKALRNKLMVQLDLSQEETNHSFPANRESVASKVKEFILNTMAFDLNNELRHTHLQREHVDNIKIDCPNNNSAARVVALRDDLGEILDVSAVLIHTSNLLNTYTHENAYALTMEQCVLSIKKDIDKSWFNDHPLREDFNYLTEQIHLKAQDHEKRAEFLVKVISDIYERSGNYSISEEINTLKSSPLTGTKKANAISYCFFLLGRTWENISVTSRASEVMAHSFKTAASDTELTSAMGKLKEKLGNDPIVGQFTKIIKQEITERSIIDETIDFISSQLDITSPYLTSVVEGSSFYQQFSNMKENDENKKESLPINVAFGKAFSALLTEGAKLNYKNLVQHQKHLAYAISSQAETITRELKSYYGDEFYIKRTSLLLGVRKKVLSATPEEAVKEIRGLFSKYKIPETNGRLSFLNNIGKGNVKVEPFGMITFDVDIEVSHTQGAVNNIRAENIGRHLSMFFGMAGVFTALNSIQENRKTSSATLVGRWISNNAYAALTVEILGIMDVVFGFAEARKVPIGEVQSGLRGVGQGLSTRGRLVAPENVNGVASKSVKVIKNFSRGISVITGLYSLAGAWEGYARDDNNATIGNALIATGSLMPSVLAFLGFNFAYSGLIALSLILIGVVITLFVDNDLEKWVRGGFWGKGDRYFYWKKEDREDYPIQLEKSKNLALNDTDMVKYFQHELKDFLELTQRLILTDMQPRDSYIEIICGAIKSESDLKYLTIIAVMQEADYSGKSVVNEKDFPLMYSSKLLSPGNVQVSLDNVSGTIGDFCITASYIKPNEKRFESTLYINGNEL